jgi:16S rRNA (cytidine1402-2'-O)-methyltransferase
VYHGTLGELAARAEREPDLSRGEIVVVVEGAAAAAADITVEIDRMLAVLLKSLPPSQAAGITAELSGARRNDCYARALKLAAQRP